MLIYLTRGRLDPILLRIRVCSVFEIYGFARSVLKKVPLWRPCSKNNCGYKNFPGTCGRGLACCILYTRVLELIETYYSAQSIISRELLCV